MSSQKSQIKETNCVSIYRNWSVFLFFFKKRSTLSQQCLKKLISHRSAFPRLILFPLFFFSPLHNSVMSKAFTSIPSFISSFFFLSTNHKRSKVIFFLHTLNGNIINRFQLRHKNFPVETGVRSFSSPCALREEHNWLFHTLQSQSSGEMSEPHMCR